MRRAVRRLAAVASVGATGLSIALLALQVFLNLVLPGLLNRQPDRLLFSLDSAWMIVPGRLHVNGLRIDGTDEEAAWTVSAEHAVGDIALGALPQCIFRTTSLEGWGVTFQYRAIEPRDIVRKPLDERWRVDLRGMHVREVLEVSYNEHRVTGQASVDDGHIRLDGPHFDAAGLVQVSDLDLVRGTRPLATGIHGEMRLTVDGLDRRGNLGLAVFHAISGQATLAAELEGLSFLDFYLADVPWLRLKGDGRMEADVSMAQGEFLPGSTIDATVPEMTVDILGWQVTGACALQLHVDPVPFVGGTALALGFRHFEFTADGGAHPLLEGEGFRVEAFTPDARLDRPFSSFDAVFELPESDIVNLSPYDALLPDGMDMDIDLSGQGGRVRGHLEATSMDHSAKGDLWLVHPDVGVMLGTVALRGDVRAHARVSNGAIEQGVFDLTGSTVDLTDVSIRTQGTDEDVSEGWHAGIALPWARVHTGAATTFSADIDLACRDSAPFVTVFGSQRHLPGWARALLTVQDLSGSARLQLGAGRMEVHDMHIEGRGYEVMVDLVRRRAMNHGQLFMRMGPLSLGLGVDGLERHIQVLRSRHWYERRVAEGAAAVPGEAGAP